MVKEAKFRARLDTRQAKAELRSLAKSGVGAAGRIGSNLRGSVMRGLGVVGVSAGVGAAVSTLRQPTSAGFSDVISEVFGGIAEKLSYRFWGGMAQEAKADRAAREETISAFGHLAGHTGEIPGGAKQWFDTVRQFHLDREQGRHLFETSGDYRSTKPEDVVDRILTGLKGLFHDAVDYLIEKLKGG